MSRRSNRNSLPTEPVEATIDTLTQDGRGVTRIDGKAVFVDGALPAERVLFTYTRRKKRHDEAVLLQIIDASPDRVEPRCEAFGSCGGCTLQHMNPDAQLRAKEGALVDALKHIGKVEPQGLLPPLRGPHWGYRHKARLGARFVEKKQRLLVGFRERGSSFIADTLRCEILAPPIGYLLGELSQLIGGLALYRQIPQIEVAMGDRGCALVFRVLGNLDDSDSGKLRGFGERHGIQIFIQEGGVESIRPLSQDVSELVYELPGQGLTIAFEPWDFTQVNPELNRSMVAFALDLLDPKPQDRVLDLFCGLGNFTLPLSVRAQHVTGVEGDPGLVERARKNAVRNGRDNVVFEAADLCGEVLQGEWLHRSFDKVLLDPPRSGAIDILDAIARSGASRIVYVSCYPATLARDARILVDELGFQMKRAGVMDMFPHTAHVESIALFER